ncbi:membrane-associated proteins in eicosanoid and glutathione metabolism [Trichocladium antarcticum]|uniref:Membrane-associated proteins in eicosanoid and glutathione metabolism n=1 Tax=Trichocladium antarcticum TaxID=1450529 RepID=A0AAN6USD5_9PEZI|nr:membrane-associated proteins in eicosanoid and glutathione metabolism [Trichocladium antarcticum]
MVTTLVTIPSEYGYVLLAATSTFFVNTYHGLLTSRYRKASGIKYPTAYASAEQADKDPKAYTFNCAQRAHNNFTENLTPFLGALLIAGTKFPVYAAAIGGAWSLGRVLFARGYTSGGPQGRMVGAIMGSLCDFTLKLMAGYVSLGYALGW